MRSTIRGLLLVLVAATCLTANPASVSWMRSVGVLPDTKVHVVGEAGDVLYTVVMTAEGPVVMDRDLPHLASRD